MDGAAIEVGPGAAFSPRQRVRRTRCARLLDLWTLLVRTGTNRPVETDEPVPDLMEGTREVDGAVLRRAQRGDHGAFHEIVDHYEGRLRVLAFHLLGDTDQMNDALQDTFVKAWCGLPAFRSDAALGTWLYRICYRICIDHLRRQRRWPVDVALADEVADTADDYAGLALRELVSAALARLPVEQRAVLLLVDREGYDYASVAEALEVPVGTVASRLSLARAAMRHALRPASGEEAPQ